MDTQYPPHQVIPGAINPYRQAFAWAIHEGEELIAYASENNVVVYHGGKFVQLLQASEHEWVTCVAWCEPFARLAIGCKNRILVYEPLRESDDFDEHKVQLRHHSLLEPPNLNFTCLSWNASGTRLLLGGPECLLWEYREDLAKWQLLWRTRNSTPVIDVCFSPDDRFFATVARHDRMVKVWYRQDVPEAQKREMRNAAAEEKKRKGMQKLGQDGEDEDDDDGEEEQRNQQSNVHSGAVKPQDSSPIANGERDEENNDLLYAFLYLPHPTAVKSIQWRKREFMQNERKFIASVLMTCARDHVIRMWSETSETEELQFHVCYAVQKDTPVVAKILNTTHEISPNKFILHYMKDKLQQHSNGGHNDLQFGDDENTTSEESVSYLGASSDTGLIESHTWLSMIQPDGSLTIDIIQGLADYPRRTPKSSTWIIMPKALKELANAINIFMYYKPYKVSENQAAIDLGYPTPNKITFYVHDKSGSLSCWELNIGKEASPSGAPNLQLIDTFTGHCGPVTAISSHPTLPLIATIDSKNQQLVAWHVRDTAYFSHSDICTNLQSYEINATQSAWFPGSPTLIVSTNKGLEILHIKTQDPNKDTLSQEYGSTIFPPLPSYYTFIRLEEELDQSAHFSDCIFLKVLPLRGPKANKQSSSALVVAVTSNGDMIGVWRVEEGEKVNNVPKFTVTTLLIHRMSSGIQITCADCDESVYKKPDQETMPHFILVIGRSDGKVSMYKLKKKEAKTRSAPPQRGGLLSKFSATLGFAKEQSPNTPEEWELVEWHTFKAEQDRVGFVKASDFMSRICTVPDQGSIAHIFESDSRLEFALEETIELKQSVCDVEWLSFGNGQSVLCLATRDRIQCFTQGRHFFTNTSGREVFWQKIGDFVSQSVSNPLIGSGCRKIAVTRERTLIASFGSLVHIFTKWAHRKNDHNETFVSKALQMHRRIPDYHPRLLNDLIMDGKYDLVKTIFTHVGKCVKSHFDKIERMMGHSNSLDEINANYIYIPSLPLSVLLSKKEAVQQKKRSLLDKFAQLSMDDDENEMDEDQKSREEGLQLEKESILDEMNEKKKGEEDEFTFAQAYKIIKSKLQRKPLPELSPIEQRTFAAILDTFNQIQSKPDALDDCGIRFLVQAKIMQFLHKEATGGPDDDDECDDDDDIAEKKKKQRAAQEINSEKKSYTPVAPEKPGQEDLQTIVSRISTCRIAWIMHSDTQECVLDMLNPCEPWTWQMFVQYGLPFWIKNPITLKSYFEKLAKDRFSATNDPTAVALHYMALKKKSTLIQFFRAKSKDQVAAFFQKDFLKDKNAQASCRENIKRLMSKQNFEYAAALYLLMEKPKDAIQLLMRNANQPELALMVSRVLLGDDDPLTKQVLNNDLIPIAKERHDTWLKCVVQWLLKDYEESLKTIASIQTTCDAIGEEKFDPTLYAYCKHVANIPFLRNSKVVEEREDSILARTVHFYSQIGSLVLAFYYLRKLQTIRQENKDKEKTTNTQKSSASQSAVSSGLINMSAFGGFGMMGVKKKPNAPLMSGMMGMMGAQMSGQQQASVNNNTQDQADTKENNEKSEEFMGLLITRLSLIFLSQLVHDVTKLSNPSADKDWNENRTRIQNDMQYMVGEFKMDKSVLKRKLKSFCKLNGLVLGRCLLVKTPAIMPLLQGVSHQVVALLSLLTKRKLTRVQVKNLERITREFIYCYKRLTKVEKVTPSRQILSDMNATIYVMLFLSAYCKSDYAALLYLLCVSYKSTPENLAPHLSMQSNVQQGSHQAQADASLQSMYTVLNDIIHYYESMNVELERLKEEELTAKREVEEDPEAASRRKKLAELKEKFLKKELNVAELSLDDYLGQTNSDVSEEEELLKDLKHEYCAILLKSLILFRFSWNLKYFFDKAVEELHGPVASLPRKKGEDRRDNQIRQYTLTAQTSIFSVALWCSYLERKLKYKELEICTASPKLPTPSFREVNAVSTPTRLSNLVDALTHATPILHRQRRALEQRVSDTMLSPRGIAVLNMDSALPELHADDVSVLDRNGEHHSLIAPIVKLNLTKLNVFNHEISHERLWKYLTEKDPLVVAAMPASMKNIPAAEQQVTAIVQDIVTDATKVSFSNMIEIVKCKELVRAFCIDRNNPSFLVYATGKLMREINIDHSIRYRKRNETKDKLLDDEMGAWDASLFRFNNQAAQDSLSIGSSAFFSNIRTSAIPIPTTYNSFDYGEFVSSQSERKLAPSAPPLHQQSSLSTVSPHHTRSSSDSNLVSTPLAQESQLPRLASLADASRKRIQAEKRPSFTALSPAVSHFKKPTANKKKVENIDHNVSVLKLISHPFLPFYLSGGVDGSIYMWQFGLPYALRTYREPTNAHVTGLHFSHFGYKFGATDSNGMLSMWRFETSAESTHPFESRKCHATRANDFTFVSSGSIVATVGTSGSVKNLCIWDLLLSYNDCIIKETLSDEASTVIFSREHNILLLGMQKGPILVYDIRKRKCLKEINEQSGSGHSSSIDSMCLDVTEDFVVSGCVDGNVKAWDLRTFKLLYDMNKSHSKHTFFNVEGYPSGITSLGVTSAEIIGNFLYTSGSDGRVVRRTIL